MSEQHAKGSSCDLSDKSKLELLSKIHDPKDLRALPADKLPQVCGEVREKILETVAKLGGHLGSSLGATEITVALHYVFNTPKDKLVWDTGHQTYGHKVLTGRQEGFATIRQFKGLSGFLKRTESEYDTFGAGHASTAISAALGMAEARDLKDEDNKVVAIVSDGCMTGGESYEGLQNAGMLQSDMIVILNDNQMFISNRVGALGTFLTKLLTLGGKRMNVGLDIFNVLNSSFILNSNNTYGPAWLTPTAVQSARQLQGSVRLDF